MRQNTQLPANAVPFKRCILEYNNRNMNPKIMDIRSGIGYEKQELWDIFETQEGPPENRSIREIK